VKRLNSCWQQEQTLYREKVVRLNQREIFGLR